jgi:hypothetical protein
VEQPHLRIWHVLRACHVHVHRGWRLRAHAIFPFLLVILGLAVGAEKIPASAILAAGIVPEADGWPPECRRTASGGPADSVAAPTRPSPGPHPPTSRTPHPGLPDPAPQCRKGWRAEAQDTAWHGPGRPPRSAQGCTPPCGADQRPLPGVAGHSHAPAPTWPRRPHPSAPSRLPRFTACRRTQARTGPCPSAQAEGHGSGKRGTSCGLAMDGAVRACAVRTLRGLATGAKTSPLERFRGMVVSGLLMSSSERHDRQQLAWAWVSASSREAIGNET